MFNLSIIQYWQLGFLIVGIIVFLINLIRKILLKKKSKFYIPMEVVNSAILPHKVIYAEPKFTDDKYKLVYLITFDNSYDIETIKYQALNTENREYDAYDVNGAEYLVIDTSITDISPDYLIALEDNYTKAILLIKQAAEYFYLNVEYPKKSAMNIRFKSIHNVGDDIRISRDELKYYKVLGKVS